MGKTWIKYKKYPFFHFLPSCEVTDFILLQWPRVGVSAGSWKYWCLLLGVPALLEKIRRILLYLTDDAIAKLYVT